MSDIVLCQLWIILNIFGLVLCFVGCHSVCVCVCNCFVAGFGENGGGVLFFIVVYSGWGSSQTNQGEMLPWWLFLMFFPQGSDCTWCGPEHPECGAGQEASTGALRAGAGHQTSTAVLYHQQGRPATHPAGNCKHSEWPGSFSKALPPYTLTGTAPFLIFKVTRLFSSERTLQRQPPLPESVPCLFVCVRVSWCRFFLCTAIYTGLFLVTSLYEVLVALHGFCSQHKVSRAASLHGTFINLNEGVLFILPGWF